MLQTALFCLSALSAASAFSVTPGINSRLHSIDSRLNAWKVSSSGSRSKSLIKMSAAGPRRVVVTGMGITSCLGNTLDDVATSLKEAR